MTSSFRQDLTTITHPSTTIDHFDQLPDPLLLLIFNSIKDIKTLGKCSLVSKRFQTLISQVHDIIMHIDCVISDNNNSLTSSCKPRTPFSVLSLIRLVFSNILKPAIAVGNFLRPKSHALLLSMSTSAPAVTGVRETVTPGVDVDLEKAGGGVTHHSPTEVLKNFSDIRKLTIELPSGELGMEDDVLVKWRAEFGSTLHNCVMLGASSVIQRNLNEVRVDEVSDNGSIPESFYINGGLKLRVVWTISSLIAASARHYLLQGIIDEHKTLESLVLTDVDGQGVLRLNKEQLEELRLKPLKTSLASKRTLVPALNMKLWYAPYLELSDGSVLKGATLVAIRPSGSKEVNDGSWVSDAFEEPYETAVRMLVKRRTYCLEMNSF